MLQRTVTFPLSASGRVSSKSKARSTPANSRTMPLCLQSAPLLKRTIVFASSLSATARQDRKFQVRESNGPWTTMPLNEADTCRTYVLPKLYSAGWEDNQISEQKTFTDGRIVLVGNRAIRRPQKRADYLLTRTTPEDQKMPSQGVSAQSLPKVSTNR